MSRDGHHLDDFNEFFRREIAALVAFLIKTGFRRHDAEDAAAEAMTRAYERWESLDAPRGWVRTTAYNFAVNQAKRAHDNVARCVAGGWCDSENDHVDQSVVLYEQHQVLRMLALLPPRQRLIMSWHLDGFSIAEIAEQENMPSATVRSTLRHARTRLKAEYLAGNNPPPVPIPRGGVNRGR